MPEAPSATGLWKVSADVMGRPVNMMCQLTEADHKLSGTCSGSEDGYAAHKVAGTDKNGKVEFYFQGAIRGGSVTLVLSGKLNEDASQMDGSMDVEPMQVGGAFSAVREEEPQAQPDSSESPQAPAAATTPRTATGTWKIEADFGGTHISMSCALTEADRKLSGTCTGGGDDDTVPRPIAGDITDKEVDWKFDARYQGDVVHVAMRGVLDAAGAKMYGSMDVTPIEADGTFLATRQPATPPAP